MAGVNTHQKRRAAVGIHFPFAHFGPLPATPASRDHRAIMNFHYPFDADVEPPEPEPGDTARPMHHFKRRLRPMFRSIMYPLWRN